MVFGGTIKMALWVKAFAATPDDLSSISMVEEDWLLQVSSDLENKYLSHPTHSHAHTERNKQMYF